MHRLTGVWLLYSLLAPAAPAKAQAVSLLDCKVPGRMTYLGPLEGDSKAGRVSQSVRFECDDTTIFADEVAWDEKTMRARGALLVQQEGLRVTAERVEMDRQTRLGIFYNAAGTARLSDRPAERSMFGTLEPEVSFEAAKFEKLGPRTYRLTDGSFTTCLQANKRWEIRGSSGTVVLDEHVLLRNAVLRVKGVPVVYLPMMYYPLGGDDRASGFLIPTYSTSTVRGHGISNAFFWAINRSQDATLYHDWFSQSGQGAGAEYRFVSSPNSRGSGALYMMDESARIGADGTVERAASRSYDVRATLNQTLPRGFRMIGRIKYFTDVTSLRLYQQNVYDASSRDRDINVSVSGGGRVLRMQALVQRRDVYTSANTAQRQGRLPQVNLWVSEQPIKGSRVYVGLNAELAGIQNQFDISQSSSNRSLWRADVSPTIRATVGSLPFLSLTTAASWRLTYWTDSLDPLTGSPQPVPITRPLAEVSATFVGPVVERIFQTPKNGYAERFKHKIEPRVSIQWFSAFDRFNQVIKNDPGVDSLVGGNATLTYSLFNRLVARRRQAGGTGRLQEVFWVGISQSYYTTASAGAYDTQYQTATAGQFSPVQISASAAPADSFTSRFQMFMDSRTLAVQTYGASVSAFGLGRMLSELSAGWSKRQYLPNVPGFDNPASASHFLNATATLRPAEGRFGGTYGFNADLKQKSMLEQRFSAFYSAQCCGVSVDYQIVNLTHLVAVNKRQDHRFNFSFTLAGIGSFSNPLGSFGR